MRTIKIFGKLTDIFQTSEYIIKEQVNTVSELKEKLVKQFPELAVTKYLVVVNNENTKDEDSIKLDAEIALLPPYSGG